MGKTSIAREIAKTVMGLQPGVACSYITLDAIRGSAHAYARILAETSGSGEPEAVGERIRDEDDAYEAFLTTLRRRRAGGAAALVVLDEMDGIVRHDFRDASLFVSRLREVANDRERYGVTFIFVSRRSLDMIQGAVDCSTLAGLCEVLYLQPLDSNGLGALAARSLLPIEESALGMLWKLTGGHPYLAEVLMCEAVDMGMRTIDECTIQTAQSAQSHEFTNQYRQLGNMLREEGMFDALCELVVGPQWRTIPPHTICLIKHYGLLRSTASSEEGVECMSEHLRDFLALYSRSTPPWALLGEAERQLRYIVQDRMVETYGDNWFEDVKRRHQKLQEALDRLAQQRVREKKMFGDAASDFILDYAYIGDLKDLIFAEWEKFRPAFGGAKADWERRFQDVMKVRNPMAHHRAVPADVLLDAERSCKAILERLREGNAAR
ncbi:MAG: hypothetical protein KJ000_05265 [Pirellulaceae bacterium]|nr:hypothetical protein [Pirellulaceae bacterium]